MPDGAETVTAESVTSSAGTLEQRTPKTYAPATAEANKRYRGEAKALTAEEWKRARDERLASGAASTLSQETFDSIVAELRTGTALRQALKEHSVSKWMFFNHIDKSALSADQYARARMASLDAMAEETMGIADDETIPSDHKRIMVDTRRWLLSKLAPKRYGDHLDVSVSANGNVSSLTEQELVTLALRARPALPAPE